MRKWVVGSLAVALLLVSILLTLVMPWPCPVNRAASERIKEGMTLEEVQSILGGPPGDYRTWPHALYFVLDGPLNPPEAEERLVELWEGDEGAVLVGLGAASTGHQTVLSVTFQEGVPSEPGLIELALWRLAKLKERLLP